MTKSKNKGFSGGVHPPENKITAGKKIVEAPLPKRAIFPLSQHLGSPSKPLVSVGDNVKRGQKIAEASGPVSAPLHASISGKISAIIPWMHPVLMKPSDAIVIESDGTDSPTSFNAPFNDYVRFSHDELRKAVTDAGIVGLGGACFPTHVKLAPPKGNYIDYLIINGCECEPYLTCDDVLSTEFAKEILSGIKIMMFITDAYQAVIAFEENKKEAIEVFKKLTYHEPNISVKALPVKYPQGAEKQLIKAVADRVVPSGGLPFNVGVIVNNIATAFAIHNAVKSGVPLYERVITVSGDAVTRPGNYKVRLGTTVSELAEFCGVNMDLVKKTIIGGPMMGIAQSSLEVPLIKGSSGVLFLSESNPGEFFNCIRCARCVMVCPMNLLPNMLSVYAEKELYDKTNDYFPFDCIECGCCSYVCPSNRPIVAQIKQSKAVLNAKKK